MSSFVTKHSKQRKTPKVIKIQWLESIWCRIGKNVEFCHKTFKTTQNYQSDQITMNCMHLTSNWQKCRVLSQNIQNNAKLQKWSKYNDLNRFDVEFAKMSSFVTKHSKQRKTPKVIKVQWLCIDLMSKWSKQRKTTKSIKLRWIASIWRRIGKNVEFCHKTFKTTQNSKSDQNTMTCIDLMLNWSKMSQFYQKHSKQAILAKNYNGKKVLSQNIQNNAKLQKWSKYNDLNRFARRLAKMSSFVTNDSKQRKTTKSIKLRWIACIWRRIGKNVEFCHKTFKTTQNSKSDQNTMTWIDLMSNWQKCRVLSQNIQNDETNWQKLTCIEFCHKTSKQRKTPKVIKIQWLESIWCRIGKNVEFCHKTFKTTQNYQIDQITMNCIDLTSNWQKCRVLSQNIQNNAKLQKWSKYNDLHRFDVGKKWSKQRKTTKSIKLRWIACIWRRIGKNVEFCHKTFKTTQNSKSDQNTMTWIDLMSNCQKCRVLSQNIQNNAKLQKWSKYNDLHRFDVEFAKMSSFVTKHSKQRKTPKVIKLRWIASIWRRIGKNVEFCHKTFKTTQNSKAIKIQWLASIWRRIGKNVEFCHKTFKTTQNSKSDQNTMTWIDLMSNWQKCRVLSQNIQNNAKLPKWSNYDELHRFDVELAKMSSFVTKHSKQRKTPKVIKIQWLESIWCRIGKNVEFCHKTFKTTQNSKSDQSTMTLHRFDVKMIKTTQNYQIDQITMNCIDLTSNWQKCRVLSQNIQNNAKLQKWSKYNDLHRFDVKMIKTCRKLSQNDSNYNAKLQTFDVKLAMKCIEFDVTNDSKQRKTTKSRSNYDELHRFDVELAKMSSFVTKHSKQRKTPKVIKIQWLESIWCRIDQKCRVLSQNIQNNAKLQKWSKYNDFASIWCQNDQNNAKLPNRSNYDELHWFDVELAKMSSFVTKHSKQRKTPKVIKIQWLESIWCRIGKNVEFCHKTFKTTQNSKSDQNTMTCIDLMLKWSKQRKTTKSIKLRWIAYIWRRIGKNVEHSKQRKTPKVIKIQWLDRFDLTCHKTFKTTQNYQKRSNYDELHDLTSNWQKCRVLSQNIQNNAKLQKWSKYNDFASIWCQNDQNNAKLPNRSNYDELHAFDVELAKMSSFVTKHSKQRKTPKVIKIQWLESIWCRIVKNVEFYQKTFKTTQNSKSDQNTMTWIDLMSNSQKCRVLSQNIQNNAKLPNRSNYDELHAFDVELAKMSSFVTKHSKQRKTPKVIKIQWLESIWCRIGKNVEFCHKTFKTTQNYQSDQITMNCIHLTSNWQKCRVLSQNIQNNAKLQKWSKYNDLNRFDVELAKMSSFVTKHSKQRKTTKAIKLRWIACIWRRIGKNVEFCHKTFKTTQYSKSDQNTMTWIDLMSNSQKCRVLSQNIQNNAKLQKWSKYNDFASIWCQNDQNNAKLPNRSNYDELHWFDVELAKMSSFVTKHSKQRKTPKVIKIQWLASIWC